MPRVIVLDTLAQEGLDLLRPPRRGIEYEVRTGLKGDALRKALAEFDGAICRSGVKITAESLEGNQPPARPSSAPASAPTTSTKKPPRGWASW